MDYYLIKGHFHLVGYSPDGDSLMFEASNPKQWDKIVTKHRATFEEKLEEKEGSCQLRLQGVDALETHYGPAMVPPPKEARGKEYAKAQKPKMNMFRQPVEYGEAATAKLMKYLGVSDVEWGTAFGKHWIKSLTYTNEEGPVSFDKKGEDRIEGYIVVNDMDRKGRPISWIFPGKTKERDGSKLTTDELLSMIKKSSNYRLVATGLVYPYFFMTLSAALRQPLIYAVLNAQRQKMNLWSQDKTEDGIRVDSVKGITEEHLVFPYLFRRMLKHQYRRQMEGYYEAVMKKKTYQADMDSLYLDSFFDDTNPYLFLIEERDFVRLDSVVQIRGNKMKLSTHPGNIVFFS
ncbi:MAG: hypothetical protein AAFY71_23945 [Bacteroidota bacterium]